jgi:hypothetical protein
MVQLPASRFRTERYEIASAAAVLALGREPNVRQAAYRDLFMAALEQAAINDVRLVLKQGQVLGSEKFKAAMSAASRVRRTQARPGRPAKRRTETIPKPDQVDFRF